MASYNFHVFITHLVDQRDELGVPLHQLSAVRYETLFGFMGRLYKSGTHNPGAQALNNFLLSQRLTHRCFDQRTMRISPATTTQLDDSLVFTYQDVLLKVLSTHRERLRCKVVVGEKYTTDHLGLGVLDWDRCGVHLYGGTSDEQVWVTRSDIAGKLLHAGRFLIKLYKPWLLLSSAVK